MSYQVLARKWRPHRFDDVVGQQHVLRPLISALTTQRLHHAYLFTGTRGVGKTTIARILAKSLNCEQGVQANPCGQCSACQEIEQGRFVDLLEIDAASRTKVEDTRELLDNVQYRPTRGRYKVYLIDEVHMLSRHSFNALLKTLEEPPEHVKFLLATTDPQKLPVTVLSRCLQFNLKALSRTDIEQHLAEVLTAEQIPFDNAALPPLARAAQGSMRDALSLTDQAIAQGQQQVDMAAVQAMLGFVQGDKIAQLLTSILHGDGQALLEQFYDIAGQTPDVTQILSELQVQLHQLALLQVVPNSDVALAAGPELQQLAQVIPADLVQVFYDIVALGKRDVHYAPDPQTGVEMVLLRLLAFRPEYLDVKETPSTTPTQVRTATSATSVPPVAPVKASPQAEPERPAASETNAAPELAVTSATQAGPDMAVDAAPELAALHAEQAELESAAVALRGEQQSTVPAAGLDQGLAGLLATRSQLQQKKKPTAITQPQATTPAAIAPSEAAAEPEPEPAPQPELAPVPSAGGAGEQVNPAPQSAEALNSTTEDFTEAQLASVELAEALDKWSQVITAAGWQAVLRQVARNTQVRLPLQANLLQLQIDQSVANLATASVRTELEQVLKQAFAIEQVQFEVSEQTLERSPAVLQQRIDAARLRATFASLAQDSLVVGLQQSFGVQLDEKNIQLL